MTASHQLSHHHLSWSHHHILPRRLQWSPCWTPCLWRGKALHHLISQRGFINAHQVNGFPSAFLSTASEVLPDLNTGSMFSSLLSPPLGMLIFCSLNEPSLPLPLRLSTWSSFCLAAFPPDLQKSHSSWSIQLCSNVILLKCSFLRKVFPFLLLSQSFHLHEPSAIFPITPWISKSKTDHAAG